MRRLGQLSREYEARATAYAELATSAANAEASHKHARAIHMLESRAGDPKMAVSWAETLADADPEVAGLLRERLETGAIADAARAKLSQLREAVATGRSVMVGEREQDRLHSAGLGGAA
jgi:hypothetical protein